MKTQELDKILFSKVASEEAAVSCRNEFCQRLSALGFGSCTFDYNSPRIPHPSEPESFIELSIQTCYFQKDNQFNGFFEATVKHKVPHEHTEACEWGWNSDCPESDVISRFAEGWEIHYYIFELLKFELKEAQKQYGQSQAMVDSLPSLEALGKMRRRIEDRLRKDPRSVLLLAPQFGITIE